MAKPKKRFWLKLSLILLSLILIPVLGVIVFIGVWQHRGSRAVTAELARITEAGEPASAAELEEFYAAPPAEADCTEFWLQAFKILDTEDFHDTYWDLGFDGGGKFSGPAPGKPWPQLGEAEAFLEQYSEALSLIHEAASRGGAARFPTDFSLGINMKMPELERLRLCARLIEVEAYVRAHHGDIAGAAESIRAMHTVAESLSGYPILVAYLVNIYIRGIEMDSLEELLPVVPFTDEQLAGFRDDIIAAEDSQDLYHAWVGERAVIITVFRDPESIDENCFIEKPWTDVLLLNDADLAWTLNCYAGWIAISKGPWPEALEESLRLSTEFEQSMDAMNSVQKLAFLGTVQLLPAANACFIAEAKFLARARAADAALAAQLYRRGHGRWPEKLEDLVPEFLAQVPTDPFDGKPLRVHHTEDELVIYSVGEDGNDDGGHYVTEELSVSGSVPLDVTFVLRRAERVSAESE
jgi:hypothetical protein